MNFKCENDVLTITLSGRVDTTNADDVGKELEDIRSNNPHSQVVLDLDELEYISSAGLRQVLRLKKKEPNVKLINVTSEIYEIFDMTGFTEMMDIEKAYRKFSVDGCEVIGEGSNGVVYRINPDTIIKVYRNSDALDDIKRERELARTALVLGINTAIPYDVVKVGDKFGSVFELLSAKSITKLIIANKDNKEEVDKYIKIFVDLLKEIHDTPVKPGLLPDAKERAINWAKDLEGKLPEDRYAKLMEMLNGVEESFNMIHGDYHTNNVHYSDEAILIDMDTLSVGNPVFELSNIFLAYQGFGELDHASVEKFLKIDWETAQYILDKTFNMYFEGTDIDAKVAFDKAQVVGLMRLYRRTLRRDKDNAQLIEYLKNRLTEEIDKVSDLKL